MFKSWTKHELDERVQIVRQVSEKKKSINTIAQEHEPSAYTVKRWARQYKMNGVDGFESRIDGE